MEYFKVIQFVVSDWIAAEGIYINLWRKKKKKRAGIRLGLSAATNTSTGWEVKVLNGFPVRRFMQMHFSDHAGK